MALLLTTNETRAQKELVFSVTRNLFKLEALAAELRGYGISLKIALIWQIQQSYFHEDIPESGVLEFNLKLDAQPLAGMIHGEVFFLVRCIGHRNTNETYLNSKLLSGRYSFNFCLPYDISWYLGDLFYSFGS